ncbi:nuclear transport factor 2 family protein [Aliidiomarina celeris]|uniref:nuclear transport factor 2 family protein n=1 Tax=Aliidiomarina celeris TaxID=2249428 RepID=UPI000DEA284E|nr:nuclear transport factor 2 family protein [Aliidiomarina celeris]
MFYTQTLRLLVIISVLTVFGLTLSSTAVAHQHNNKHASVQQTLEQFLYGASIGSAEIHNQFWAEELVYTSSSGTRFGKAELMQGMQGSSPIAPEQVNTWYGAEQVQIRFVNDLALLSFTLTAGDGEQINSRFYNSGVLIFRDQRWQVLNWHATVKTD